MVGKKELLCWVSDMCGRPVVSFSALKDGDALVRCVKETWPLAYDECRPRFPKRMDGTREPRENFALIQAIFAALRLPPAALDVRGVRASAFKPCYNLLVVCFFLRNLALHGDFSVDFTHPIEQSLAQFLQSPASIASLRRGGALEPSPSGEPAAGRPRRTPKRPDASTRRLARAEKAVPGSAFGPASPPPGLPLSVFRPPSPSRPVRGSIPSVASDGDGVGTLERFADRPRTRRGTNALGRFLRRRSAGGSGGGASGASGATRSASLGERKPEAKEKGAVDPNGADVAFGEVVAVDGVGGRPEAVATTPRASELEKTPASPAPPSVPSCATPGDAPEGGGSPAFLACLGERDDERRVERLQAEATPARDVAAASGRETASEAEDETEPEDDSDADAADAGVVLRAVAVLRDSALERGGDDADTANAVTAAARAAEAAVSRRAAAAAVSRRRLRDARAAAAEARGRVALSETEARAAEASGEAREASLRRRARDAEEDLARERAACGVRVALAEEASRLARSEAEEARGDATEAADALRDARDVVAKLRLRETHWVGLVRCHREAASASRAIAECVSRGWDAENADASSAFAARPELETIALRRVELEAEASGHAEAVEAVERMLPEAIGGVERVAPAVGEDGANAGRGEPTRELARLEARASAAESAAETLRLRLARKTEDAAALALRAKRHELRAEEAALAVAAGERERREAMDAFRVKQDETDATVRRLRREASAATREASVAKAALEDRDAALDVGVAVARADVELARLTIRRGDGDGSGGDARDDDAQDEEDIARTESGSPLPGSPAPSFGGFAPIVAAGGSSAKQKRDAPGGVPLTSPAAMASAVAEATRANATTPGSVASRAGGGASLSRDASRDERRFDDVNDADAPPRARFSESPGGESVGSVAFADAASARAVDAAGDAFARGAAEAGARGRSREDSTPTMRATCDAGAERETREPPRSPFRALLDALTPRRRGGRSPRAAASSVEEETEDSEAVDPSVSSASEGDENAANASASAPRASRATPRSPVPDVSGSSFGTSLPGGSSFMREAEAHLAIEVKKAWFGLRDDEGSNASPSSKPPEANSKVPA